MFSCPILQGYSLNLCDSIRNNIADLSVSICRNCSKLSNVFRSSHSFRLLISLVIAVSTHNITPFLISIRLTHLLIFSKPSMAMAHAGTVETVMPPQPRYLCVGNILINSGTIVLYLSLTKSTDLAAETPPSITLRLSQLYSIPLPFHCSSP